LELNRVLRQDLVIFQGQPKCQVDRPVVGRASEGGFEFDGGFIVDLKSNAKGTAVVGSAEGLLQCPD
jgi:hypothetical protein